MTDTLSPDRLELPDRTLVRLPLTFFEPPTPELAPSVIGLYLVRQLPGGERMIGRIVEVEAYHGMADTACHARVGMTERTAVMFGPPGHAYVYLIYGMYHMLNISTNTTGEPAAVLIRGLEPVAGIEFMSPPRKGKRSGLETSGIEARATRADRQASESLRKGRARGSLTNGPGKLCSALQIDRSLNGVNLLESHDLFLACELPLEQKTPMTPRDIATSPRIGIDYAEQADREIHWRFFERDNPWVSKIPKPKVKRPEG